MADVKRFVNRDPANSPGGSGITNATSGTDRAYYTLNEWEAAEQTDLVTDGDTHLVECTGTIATEDTTALTIDGWTTGASNDITIDGLDPFDSYQHATTSQYSISVLEEYVALKRLRVEISSTANYKSGIRNISTADTASSLFTVIGCVVFSAATIGVESKGIHLNAGTNNILVNNIVRGNLTHGIDVNYLATPVADITLYNNTVDNATTGITFDNATVGTATVRNNIVQGGTTDYNVGAPDTFTHNISEDTSGNSGFQSVVLTFADAEKHLASGDTEAIGTGANLYSDAIYAVTDDVDGDARPDAAFDIGADHYVSAGGADPVPPLRRRMMMRSQ